MNKYASYNPDQLEDLFSRFLIDSWSYSKVVSFARNEKSFEKEEIYRERSRRSATTVAGSAYHAALEVFFKNLSYGVGTSIVDMEREAYNYIDTFPANQWKLQKTTPTINDCIEKANESVTALIRNFEKEKSVYLEDLKEIIGVELRCNEWITINGVDIPLPCHAVIDLIVKLKNGKTVIIDHKAKEVFADDKESAFVNGKQAIAYIKCLESKLGIVADEVWFIENKSSQNKDGSPQLRQFKIFVDKDTLRLYEAQLYEPLKRMLEAVSDPDHVYMINDSDKLVDMAELYEFWAKTLIAEVDDSAIPDSKKPLMEKRQKKIRDASLASINPKTISIFRENAASFIAYDLTNKDMTNNEKVEHVLRTFNVMVRVAHEISGYSSDTYLLEVGAGEKISNIMRYKLDIANTLNVPSVRIGSILSLYQNKTYLVVEAPKKRTKDLAFDTKYLKGKKLPIGMDNFGQTVVWDLDNHSTPHVLVCGATGSGKSVSIKSTIAFAQKAGVKDIVIFDPKYEFCSLKGKDIQVYNEIEEIELKMRSLVEEMQERAKTGEKKLTLVIFDEFADAVAAAKSGAELDIREEVQVGFYAPKKVKGIFGDEIIPGEPKYEMKATGRHKSLEENMKILLQKGRSLGYRIMAATQRASVKVITGDAKVNFPVQVCFRVPREIDSKVVLDESGAETLGGMGDGLIKSPEYMDVVRFQGFYKS